MHTIEKLIRKGLVVEKNEASLLWQTRNMLRKLNLVDNETSLLAADLSRHYAGYHDDTDSYNYCAQQKLSVWPSTPSLG